MKSFIALTLGLLVSLSASAYDVKATMPTTSGASACRLYLDGVRVGASDQPCGAEQSYPNLLTSVGTYRFTYTAVNATGETAQSPIATVVIGLKPVDPTQPPAITVNCTPAPCPANTVITVTIP